MMKESEHKLYFGSQAPSAEFQRILPPVENGTFFFSMEGNLT